MSVTLCIPPRAGEVCALIHFVLREQSTVMELTARHRVVDVVWDDMEDAVVAQIEITDPATARPIDVRIDVVRRDHQRPSGRTRLLGHVDRRGEQLSVFGTYLGVVADEN